MKCYVEINQFAKRQMERLPEHIQESIIIWIDQVNLLGIKHVRKCPGYFDEPLQGKHWGQRSIRLSFHYRLVYLEAKKNEIEILGILEEEKND
jgi:hypothetical protein